MRALKRVPPCTIQTRGRVSATTQDYAREKVLALVNHLREPILAARVRLTQMPDPAIGRPALAQATLDVDGRSIRAHVAAATMREAIDLLQDRLRVRLDRVNPHWEARRGGVPCPVALEWRHDSEPTHRPDYYPRPVEERSVVRHKSYALASETVDEAILELESMDYDFHLFTETSTLQEGVVYRAGPTGYRLALLHAPGAGGVDSCGAVTVSNQSAPRLDVPAAIDRLELSGRPFMLFADARTGRAAVLYHRYDGNYGLVTSAAQPRVVHQG